MNKAFARVLSNQVFKKGMQNKIENLATVIQSFTINGWHSGALFESFSKEVKLDDLEKYLWHFIELLGTSFLQHRDLSLTV